MKHYILGTGMVPVTRLRNKKKKWCDIFIWNQQVKLLPSSEQLAA
jgi:hypothetical protein